MVMSNRLTTTVMHQAITSKADNQARVKVIRKVLEIAPEAAALKNGFGSLPLHCLLQRNVKLGVKSKEELTCALIDAYPAALLWSGGKGKRTPLHVLFTDYISERLVTMMIIKGPQACFMKDKKGYLPIHVACNRHCSPEKLRMLIAANPASLFAKTNDGSTPLSLAKATVTKSHQNTALISELESLLKQASTNIFDMPVATKSMSKGTLRSSSPPIVSRKRQRDDTFVLDSPLSTSASSSSSSSSFSSLSSASEAELLLHFSQKMPRLC